MSLRKSLSALWFGLPMDPLPRWHAINARPDSPNCYERMKQSSEKSGRFILTFVSNDYHPL